MKIVSSLSGRWAIFDTDGNGAFSLKQKSANLPHRNTSLQACSALGNTNIPAKHLLGAVLGYFVGFFGSNDCEKATVVVCLAHPHPV